MLNDLSLLASCLVHSESDNREPVDAHVCTDTKGVDPGPNGAPTPRWKKQCVPLNAKHARRNTVDNHIGHALRNKYSAKSVIE